MPLVILNVLTGRPAQFAPPPSCQAGWLAHPCLLEFAQRRKFAISHLNSRRQRRRLQHQHRAWAVWNYRCRTFNQHRHGALAGDYSAGALRAGRACCALGNCGATTGGDLCGGGAACPCPCPSSNRRNSSSQLEGRACGLGRDGSGRFSGCGGACFFSSFGPAQQGAADQIYDKCNQVFHLDSSRAAYDFGCWPEPDSRDAVAHISGVRLNILNSVIIHDAHVPGAEMPRPSPAAPAHSASTTRARISCTRASISCSSATAAARRLLPLAAPGQSTCSLPCLLIACNLAPTFSPTNTSAMSMDRISNAVLLSSSALSSTVLEIRSGFSSTSL